MKITKTATGYLFEAETDDEEDHLELLVQEFSGEKEERGSTENDDGQ